MFPSHDQIERERIAAQEDIARKAEDSARQDKIDRERIAAQEDIAEMRDDTARARLDQQKQLKIQDLLNKYNK